MTNYLLFQLYGALASWGDIAVGGHRPTLDHPTRSAILGLVGAALGLRREQSKELGAIASGYSTAVRVNDSGTLLTDFHTAQVPSASALKHRVVQTRREELSALSDYNHEKGVSTGTILSTREYRADAHHTIALWTREEPPYALDELRRALLRPKFTLWLGRKSCPLGLPMQPQVIQAQTLVQALGAAEFMRPPQSSGWGQRRARGEAKLGLSLYWDEDVDIGIGWQEKYPCRDNPGSRQRWQFQTRTEYRGVLEESEETCI